MGYDRDRLLARYSWVVHLTTTAAGEASSYTVANNAARRETPEEAVEVDLRTRAAWAGHPNIAVIPPHQDFGSKIDSTLKIVSCWVKAWQGSGV
jgi:hypothetical protein